MALIDKASLLMVPSTYEAGKLYNVLPSGNRAPDSTGENSGYDQTRADFDFDRGSNAAATRVNADGLIEKYRENLFTNSNMFTGISLDGITRTTAQADPLGGSNAVLFTENTNTGTHRWYNTTSITSSAVYTISVFAKANGVTDLQIAGAAGIIGRFDLSTGEAFTSGIGIDAKIESIGTDGWYRCSATYNGSGWIGLYLAQGTSISYTGDGTSGIYAYGYQVELGLVATEYLESTSVTGKAGVLIDLPRIDYSSGAGALLLEPQRANVHTYSNYFGDSYYIKDSGVSVTTNNATSPEGLQNASKVSVSDNGRLYANHTSGTYTTSVFIKAGTFSHFKFNSQNVDLTTSPISVGSLDFEDYGNGWYRVYGTYTGNRGFQIQAYPDNTYSSHTDSGNYYIYGAQLEQGSYATSYIPNHGTSSGVTRAAERLEVTGANGTAFKDMTSGTLLMDFEFNKEITADALTWRSSGSPTGRGYLYDVRMGMADGYGNNITLTEGTRQKCIWRLNSLSNATVFANGVKGSTANGNTWNDIDTITLLGSRWNFKINSIQVFKEALTDEECINLTTL
jgi:hypothetical protein